jgi:nitronate monooxygenase
MPQYSIRKNFFSEDAKYKVLTKVFSGRLMRAMSNRLTEELKEYEKDFAPFPMQGLFLRTLYPKVIADNRQEFMAFLAGQSAPLLKYKDTMQLFNALVEDTEKILKDSAAAQGGVVNAIEKAIKIMG